MASELLTKWVLHEKRIMTYRLLSRQMSIHVNAAKNELASFYDSVKTTQPHSIYATFVITGLAKPPKSHNGLGQDDEMDVDGEESTPKDTRLSIKLMLVSEEQLEAAKAGFVKVRAIHVYSVSPSPIKDPSILATTLDAVRKVDASASQDQLRAFGIAIGDVSAIPAGPIGKGKGKATETAASKASPLPIETVKSKLEAVEVKKEEAKPKALTRTGTLDWSKAKKADPLDAKESKQIKQEPVHVAPAAAKAKEVKLPKEEPDLTPAPSLVRMASAASAPEEVKRGTKRPSPTPEPTRKASGIGRKRAVVLSSDEEEDDAPAAPKLAPKPKVEPPADDEDEEYIVRPKKGRDSDTKGKSIADEEKVDKKLKRNGSATAADPIEDADDDDDYVVRPKKGRLSGEKGKGKAVDEEVARPKGNGTLGSMFKSKKRLAQEASLKAMFDSSDVEMEPADAAEPPEHPIEVKDVKDEDSEPEPEPEVEQQTIDKPRKIARAKAKPKEGAVVMRGGKKKRRVIKSKMGMNERGYMVTEDYSDYESVSESEELTVPEKGKKAKERAFDVEKAKEPKEEVKAKPKPKPTAKPKGTGKVSDYFSKK